MMNESETYSSPYASLQSDFLLYDELITAFQNNQEEIFKLNRDVTRKSKRVISNLHRYPGMDSAEKLTLLSEAKFDMIHIRDDLLGRICNLMLDCPDGLYTKSILSGMEELIEALLFFGLLRMNKVLTYYDVAHFLCHSKTNSICEMNSSVSKAVLKDSETEQSPKIPDEGESQSSNHTAACKFNEGKNSQDIFGADVLHCRPQNWQQIASLPSYLMGLGDFSGETMRYFIKCSTLKEMDASSLSLDVLRQIQESFCYLSSLPAISKSFTQKVATHKRNLAKVEKVLFDDTLIDVDTENFQSERNKELHHKDLALDTLDIVH